MSTAGQPDGPRRSQILLVDDDIMLLRAWARQLDQAGFDVCVAASARDAIGLLARAGNEFDAIVCDLHMADSGGIDLYRSIESGYPGMQRRVVFVTGAVFSPQESEFLRMTEQPVLGKPWKIERLAAILNARTTRRRTPPGAGKALFGSDSVTKSGVTPPPGSDSHLIDVHRAKR